MTDSLSQSVVQSFTLDVTTSGFYFVATDGDDTTGTGASSSPWATINKALNSGVNGNTIYVRGGTYVQNWSFVSGKANRLVAYPGESPVADFNFHGSSILNNDTYIDGFEIKNIIFKAFQVDGGLDRIIFRRNHMHDLYDNSVSENPSFIFFWGVYPNQYTNIVIQDNVFNDLYDRASGLHGDTSANYHGGSTTWYAVGWSLYEDNTVYNIDGDGMKDKDHGYKNTMRGNVIHDCHYNGIGLSSQGAQSYIEVINNLIYAVETGVAIGSQPGYLSDVSLHQNTIIGSLSFAGVLDEASSTNINIYNNIIGANATYPYAFSPMMVSDGGSAYHYEYSTWYQTFDPKMAIDKNIVWTSAGTIAGCAWGIPAITWSAWQAHSFDVNGINANPNLDANYTVSSTNPYYGIFGALTKYTTASIPLIPSISVISTSSMKVVINANNSAAALTTFSIKINSNYLQANGTLGATPVYQNYSTWGGSSGKIATGLATNTSYSISVDSKNGSNPATDYSAVTTQATTIPVYTLGGALSGIISGTLVLQNNLKDNLSLTSNSSFVFATATTTGMSYSVTVLTQPAGQTCTVSNGSGLVGYRNVGNVLVNCVDSQAPTVPTGLSATAISTSQINLSWTASTDTVGVSGYKLYRGGSFLATSTGTTFSDTGLTVSTQYSYSVSAVDAAGNISASSSAAIATTQAVAVSSGGGGSVSIIVPPVINAHIIATSTNLLLSWTNPTSSNFSGVKVLRKIGSAPSSATDNSATVAYTGTGNHYLDTNLAINQIYYYSIYGYYGSNYSTSVTLSGSRLNSGSTIINPSTGNNSAATTPITTTATSPAVPQTGGDTVSLIGKNITEVNTITSAETAALIANPQFVNLNSVTLVIYKKVIVLVKKVIPDINKYSIADFIQNGTPTTQILGAGERGATIGSFNAAFNRLPENQTDWQDTIKIGNGRRPIQQSTAAEDRAKVTFKQIYLRAPDLNNKYDQNAVMVMAYGLRPALRNLASEKAAIKSFKYIYHRVPASAIDWDAVRAIAYSGAKR